MNIHDQLPALQVVIPLLAAPICALIPHAALAWMCAFVAMSVTAFISVKLALYVSQHGAISYTMGGWPAPFGIAYHIDGLTVIFLLLISVAALVALFYSLRSVEAEVPESKHSLFYSVFLLCVTGLLGIVITNDAFNVYVFLEISSLATYALIGMGKDRRALTSALEYLILGTIGATFILIGIGLLYMMTGTLNIADLSQRLVPLYETSTVQVGCFFIIIGILLKIALFPLHSWLASAYGYAPSCVSAFLSGVATKVAVYMLLRFVYGLFGVYFVFDMLSVQSILPYLALGGILLGSTVALFQQDVKRLLAFSSVAQIGYIILGVALNTSAGLVAALTHSINHAMVKTALFMVVGAVALRVGGVALKDFAGLGRAMPWTMGAFIVAGLGLMGVPLTAGFVSKWLLFQALFEHGQWWMLAIIVLSSIMAIFYIGKIIEIAYFRKRSDASPAIAEAPLSMRIALWTLALASLWFGVQTDWSVGLAQKAVATLTGGAI